MRSRTGRPRGVRDWELEPYRDAPPFTSGGRVKISTTVDRGSLERYHEAARAMGVSLSYLLDELADRLQINEKTGTVTLEETPITSPRHEQEAFVISA